MKFNQHLKRAEGTKTPKVELTISIDGVAIQDPKTKKISYQYPLHRISYCADDKTDPKFFSFIAKEADSDRHNCFVFVSDKLAEEITLTIGQAFDLAYRRFLDTSGRDLEMRKQFMMLHKRVQELEAENKQLRCRLSVYENSSKSRSSSTTRLPSSSSHQTAGRNQNSASNGVGQPPKLQPIQPPPQSRSRNSSSSQSVNLLNIDLLDDQPTVGRKLENLNLEDASLFSLNSSSSYMQPVTNNNNLINSNLNNNNNNNNNTNSASSLIDSNHSSYISISNGFKNGHSNGSTHNGTGTTDIFGFAPFNPANSNEKTAEDPFGMDPFNNKLGTFQAKELEQAIGDIDKKLAEMRVSIDCRLLLIIIIITTPDIHFKEAIIH